MRQRRRLHHEMLFLVLLLLLNEKEGAHATQGKQTYCVDLSPFLIVVVDVADVVGTRRGVVGRGVVLNEKNIVIDRFQRLVD